MASASFLSLTLCFIVLFSRLFRSVRAAMGTMGGLPATAGAHHVQARGECRIQRLNAQEPNRRLESEAGVTEFWDRNDNENECAGVKAIRHVIQPRGLLLPVYNNAPQLIYIVEGRGIQGTVIPGCGKTYESGSQSSSGDRKRRIRDRHQKFRRFQEGDILALPAGVTHWAYNDGECPLTCMALVDTGNEANQLDENFRLSGRTTTEIYRARRRRS